MHEEADISIYFVDGKSDQYEVAVNNKKYQERDFEWFGNFYPKGNYLCNSFGKYNFYDTDAAVRFANETDLDQIRNAFFSLALGANANYIDERINKILDKFEDAKRENDRIANEFKSLIKSAEKTLTQVSQNENSVPEYFASSISIR